MSPHSSQMKKVILGRSSALEMTILGLAHVKGIARPPVAQHSQKEKNKIKNKEYDMYCRRTWYVSLMARLI